MFILQKESVVSLKIKVKSIVHELLLPLPQLTILIALLLPVLGLGILYFKIKNSIDILTLPLATEEGCWGRHAIKILEPRDL